MSHAAGASGTRVIARAAVALLLLANGALVVLHDVLAPQWRRALFGEDRLVESTTALLFLLAFAVGAFRWMTTRGRRQYLVALPLFSVVSLFGFLDEISFGTRLFGWVAPPMKGGGEFDGLHDTVMLAYRIAAEHGLVKTVFFSCIAVVMLALWAVWRSAKLRALARRIARDRAYRWLVVAILLISTAMIIDLDIGLLRRLGPLEELCEMNGALALLLAVLVMARARPNQATAIEPVRQAQP